MRAKRPLYRQGTALVVLVACLVGASRAAPDAKDEQRLRDRALQLNEITGQDPIVGELVALLDDKDGTRKLLKVAYKMARDGDKEKDKDPVFNLNATFILARAAHGLKENDISEYFYRQYAKQALKLGSGQKLVRAYTGLIDVLLQAKKFDQAEKVCQEFLESAGNNATKMTALRQMALVLTKKGKSEQALKMIDNLIKVADRRVSDPRWPEAVVERILLRDLKGRVLREAGKYVDSAQAWEDLLDILAKDKELKEKAKENFADQIRYGLSGVYVDLKQIGKATKYLETLLNKEKDNPQYNNDLGFIWADNDMNLEQAEKLIRRALDEERKLRRKIPDITPEQDKDNAAYLDSLGWVLYKRKKHKEALSPLLEAIKQEEGQHVEIFDHLGDVYVALGEKDKAVEAWKKGLECVPLTKRDEQRKADVEKKIKKLQEK